MRFSPTGTQDTFHTLDCRDPELLPHITRVRAIRVYCIEADEGAPLLAADQTPLKLRCFL